MSKTAYNISLKGYVGGYDFDHSTVDRELAKNDGKKVNVLIDSLGGSLAPACLYPHPSRTMAMSMCISWISMLPPQPSLSTVFHILIALPGCLSKITAKSLHLSNFHHTNYSIFSVLLFSGLTLAKWLF